MLTDKDLRVDNWMLLNGKPERVTAIDSQGINGSWGWEGMDYDFEFYLEYPAFTCTLEPIPLTPDVLVKAGFKWIGSYLSIDLKHARMRLAFCNGVCDKMTIFQYQGGSYDSQKEVPFNFGANHPSYVHQLQNLYFSLTGEELEISL